MLHSNPFFSMKGCKMLHKILVLSKATNSQHFFICLLITLPLILASFTLKRKYIKILKIYELDMYYLNTVWAVGHGRNSSLRSNSKCFSTTQNTLPLPSCLFWVLWKVYYSLSKVSPSCALRNSDWRIQSEADDFCKIHLELQWFHPLALSSQFEGEEWSDSRCFLP